MKYLEPEMEIVELYVENIIVTSLNGGDDDVSTETETGGSTSAGKKVW